MLEIISIFTSSLVLVIAFYICCIIIAGKKENCSKVHLVITIIIASILNTLIYHYTEASIKTLLICLLYTLFLSDTFKIQLSKSIFISIIFITLIIIPDLLVLESCIYVFGIGKEYCYSTISGGMISNICVSLIMILLIYILRRPLRKLFNYNISTNNEIIFMSIITILFISIFFYKFAVAYKMNKEIIAYLIAMFSFMMVLFSLFKQKLENEVVLKKYDELLDVMKNYESDIEEQRTIIHETKNEITTIRCKIKDKEKEETIIDYIDSILGDKISSNMTKYSKFKYLPSNGLKGFFYYKFIEAERKGIKVSANISKQIEKSYLKDLDIKDFKALVRIIGVYLDNAIEASLKSEEKKIGIEVYLTNEVVKIIISNTYENTIDINKVGRERYSTKGKNRGHGLLLVNKILHENNMFESKNKVTDTLYIQELLVKNYSK